jgi:RNA polymerase sigma factor (sigma-70 family)
MGGAMEVGFGCAGLLLPEQRCAGPLVLMTMNTPLLRREQPSPGHFPTTHWSRVVAAKGSTGAEASEALAALCDAYWYPIYAFIRCQGYAPDSAQDLTQEFFAYILERDIFAKADPALGRFRTFLRTVCARQLANHRDRENTRKRGGGRLILSIDARDAEGRYSREPTHGLTAERIYDRSWALTLLDRVLGRLRREYDAAGWLATFEELQAVLTRLPENDSYATIAGRLGTSEGAVRVAAHRLRRRYGKLLRQEIAATVDTPAEVDDEIQSLFAALED